MIAIGVKEIVIMGSVGGLGKTLKISDLVLCTKALRDEGTSHHYLKNSKYISSNKELTERFGRYLDDEGINFTAGPTWTIDAPYMETAEEVLKYYMQGILTVEMEAAALFAVAKKRNIKVAALFVVSDLLRVNGWSGFIDQEEQRRTIYPLFIKIFKHFANDI